MNQIANRPSKHAHHMVHATAVAMAHELYDTMMQDNTWYEYWKELNPEISPKGLEDRSVAKNLGQLIPQARAALAGMLGNPMTDEKIKESIYEALVLDNTLIRGRR